MEFLKKHKKALIITVIVLFVIIGLWMWYASRKKAATTETNEVWGVSTDAVSQKIAKKINVIKNSPEWYAEVKKKAVPFGVTVNQMLAIDAIWALKNDGDIPMDTYGEGINGHQEYVKKNF